MDHEISRESEQVVERSRMYRFLLAIAIIAALTSYDSVFILEERQSAVITRFGRPCREVVRPGVYAKWMSPIDQIHRVDRRKRLLSPPRSAVFTRDKRNIVVTTFMVWHIERPLMFLQSLGSIDVAETSLSGMAIAATNQHVAGYTLDALVSTNPGSIRVEEIEQEIANQIAVQATDRWGITIDQIGVERIEFPDENLTAVLDRMRTERIGEANRLRAEGAREAQAIRDDAHIKTQEILRRGKEEASRIEADAEREAATLLAEAHAQNADFYAFWSSLQAMKRLLREKATLVLTTDQLFFDSAAYLSPTPMHASTPRPLAD